MTRWLARLALVLIAAGAAFGTWSVRIYASSRLWPFVLTHHPRLLIIVVGAGVWIVVGVLVVGAAFVTIFALWKAATEDP